MSAGKSYMRLKSCDKKKKLQVTLGQPQSLADDLRKQQAQMDYMFENQSTTRNNTSNNESMRESFCSTSNQPQGTPLFNLSKTSNNYFPKSININNQKNNFNQFNTIPQESITSTINESQNSTLLNTKINTNFPFNKRQNLPVTNTINRQNPIQSNLPSRLTNISQNNPLSQQMPYQYQNQPSTIKTNENQQLPIKITRKLPIQQLNNLSKNNSIHLNTIQIKPKNCQLQQTITQLENQLKSEKSKNYQLQQESQQNFNQINTLKTKLNQLEQKSHLMEGSHKFEKRKFILQNQHLQLQLTNEKNKIKNLQKIILQKDYQKQKIIREKQYQFGKIMDQMQMNVKLKNKQINQKAQQIKNLSDMIDIQQKKSNHLEEIIKTIKQQCQQQYINKFQSEIFRLQNFVGQLQKQIQKRDQQKQGFAKQIQIKLENYMKSTYK